MDTFAQAINDMDIPSFKLHPDKEFGFRHDKFRKVNSHSKVNIKE